MSRTFRIPLQITFGLILPLFIRRVSSVRYKCAAVFFGGTQL
jgi:hypothetical protein